MGCAPGGKREAEQQCYSHITIVCDYTDQPNARGLSEIAKHRSRQEVLVDLPIAKNFASAAISAHNG